MDYKYKASHTIVISLCLIITVCYISYKQIAYSKSLSKYNYKIGYYDKPIYTGMGKKIMYYYFNENDDKKYFGTYFPLTYSSKGCDCFFIRVSLEQKENSEYEEHYKLNQRYCNNNELSFISWAEIPDSLLIVSSSFKCP